MAAGIIEIPGRLQSVQAAAFARNPRPTSSECAPLAAWLLFWCLEAREIDCFGAGGKITSGLNPSEAAKEKHRQAATRSVANFGRLKDYWKAKPTGKPGSATAE
jgi:hypothetical protein